ncbi:MAG: SDR family NAD(P)-dependent oxidoreductase [Polyangiaceae bacterium]
MNTASIAGSSSQTWLVTGSSRGIGAALVRALAADARSARLRMILLARDEARLTSLARELEPAEVVVRPVDLASPSAAAAVGERLASEIEGKAILVHNAGLWPRERVVGASPAVEASFAVNCLSPLALQAPLLRRGALSRVLVVGAGLMVLGRFDAERTPVGLDFSSFRTYANTKLAGAIAMREAARRYPEVDFAVVHPGVVRTELGDRDGLLGRLLTLAKRRMESPEVCAARLTRLLAIPRWQDSPGAAAWYFEEERRSWPAVADRYASQVLAALSALAPTD